MIIVFFHVLYLIGRMMYENCHAAKRKQPDADGEPGEPPKPANCPTTKRHASDPFAAVTAEDFDGDGPRAPRFSPPAYIQRYIAVQKVLADPRYQGKIRKVVDFGCSELGFLTHLKNTTGIEEILCVDVDRETLEFHKTKAIPLNADYLVNRPKPLSIHVYEGSVTQRDKALANCDAVVAIELIEHLYPDILMDLPHNIFGYIKPLVAAITTPNADFNVLFPGMENEMRHWDHKFEWTRQQFEDWANNIVSRYPEYQVSFEGIGAGPAGTEHLGCCSQMAVFSRTCEATSLPICGVEGLFIAVSHQEYPYRVDNRSDEQKIHDEASYYIRRYTVNNSECLEEYPLASLLQQLETFNVSAETLREILENGGYTVVDREDGAAILCPALSTFSDYEDDTNDDIGDEWNDDYVREASPFRENVGTWGDGNVEAAYDECWDDDYEIPATNVRPRGQETPEEATEPVRNIALEAEFSLTRSLDTADFNSIEISNASHVHSALDPIDRDALRSFESVEIQNNRNFPSIVASAENATVNRNENSSFERKTEAVNSGTCDLAGASTSRTRSGDAAAGARDLAECSITTEETLELGSLCSIYLESSRNEDRDACPASITNPSFDCASLECSFETSRNSGDATAAELQIQGRLSTTSAPNGDVDERPRFTSSPRASLECREADRMKSVSAGSLRSDGNFSAPTTTSSDTSFVLRQFYPPDENSMYKSVDTVKLRGGNEASDCPREATTNSESREVSSSESLEANNAHEELVATRAARHRAPESLELRSTTSSKESEESLPIIRATTHSLTCSKEFSTNPAHSDAISATARISSHTEPIVRTIDENIVASTTHKANSREIEEYGRSRHAEASEGVEGAKPASPDAPETPPNSWSPEIMDSGYPNSSSTQDMTPEYDLSSIAQDRISDSESPSVAEAPRLGFLDHADVENGDLANNNRDDEGNNMIAEDENDLDEDLQPLIDVLENDLENENDIYALENGFPVWLLRILERGNARQALVDRLDPDDDDDGLEAAAHAAGDAGIPDRDEGFDSTSSEDDVVDEASTESSEETLDWSAVDASGDYY